MKAKNILCVLVCLCILSGCSSHSEQISTSGNTINTNDQTESNCEHDMLPATCTESKRCSVCGVTIGDPLNHDYIEGKCVRCGEKDPNFEIVYSVGEKWIVDGEWEFTIDSVKRHYLCNDYSNELDNYTNEQVVLIEYTFKNIGYNGINSGWSMESENILSFWGSTHFSIYDQENIKGDTYACIHDKADNATCKIGYTCKTSQGFVLNSHSNTITLEIKHILTNLDKSFEYAQATYVLNVE